MCAQVLKGEVEFANEPDARSFAKIFQVSKIWRLPSAPPFQIISGMPPLQERVAQLFPRHTAYWVRLVVIEAAAQQTRHRRAGN